MCVHVCVRVCVLYMHACACVAYTTGHMEDTYHTDTCYQNTPSYIPVHTVHSSHTSPYSTQLTYSDTSGA